MNKLYKIVALSFFVLVFYVVIFRLGMYYEQHLPKATQSWVNDTEIVTMPVNGEVVFTVSPNGTFIIEMRGVTFPGPESTP